MARACVALLSDWFPATTGELLHVDGGFHAMGTALVPDGATAAEREPETAGASA